MASCSLYNGEQEQRFAVSVFSPWRAFEMKLSQRVSTNISDLQARGDHHINIADRVQRRCSNLSSVYNKPASYYEGLAHGSYSAINSLLMAHNAYGGFVTYRVGNFEQEHYMIKGQG
jgi:hypothetical protein